MFKQQIIDQISKQIAGLLKNNPLADLESNIKSILHASLIKLDLVSREEFDVQQQVLAHTRARLEQLEQQVNQLTKHD